MADETESIAVQLASLRGEMTTGFATIGGQLDVIAESQGRTARDVDDLDKRVTALEARRVPWPLVAAVSGAVSAVGAFAGYMVQ